MVLNRRLQSRCFYEFRFFPRTFVHFYKLRNFRQSEVVLGRTGDVHEFIARQKQILLRRNQFHGGNKIGLSAQFIFRRESVVELGVRTDQMNPVAAADIQRHPCNQTTIWSLCEFDGAAALSLLKT